MRVISSPSCLSRSAILLAHAGLIDGSKAQKNLTKQCKPTQEIVSFNFAMNCMK